MSPQSLISEARARITWGETPQSVHSFLISSGMSRAEADAKLQQLIAERNREVRKVGLGRICAGIIILCAAGVPIFILIGHPSQLFPAKHARVICGLVLVGVYGIWQLVNGLMYFALPKSEQRSVHDI